MNDSLQHLELEWKYALDSPSQGKAILESPFLREYAVPESERTVPMDATYYDTSDGQLTALRVGYRIRQEGASFVATIKWSDGEDVSGYARRREYNQAAADNTPDLSLFLPSLASDPSPVAAALQALATKEVRWQPLFRAPCLRQLLRVRFRQSRIEVSVDQGELIADARKAPICELECELVHGSAADLHDFCERLATHFGLKPLPDSKFQRGLALRTG